METAVSQRNPREKPECIIALTGEPHGASSFITPWASEPGGQHSEPYDSCCPGRPPVTFRACSFQSLKDPSACREATGRGAGGAVGASFSVDMPAPPARRCGLSALFCPTPACTPLSSTPRGSSCYSPRVQGSLLGLSGSHLPSLPLAGSPSSYQLLMQNAGGQLWSKTDPHRILGTVTVGFRAIYLNSVCIDFPICKMGISLPSRLHEDPKAKSGARSVAHNTCSPPHKIKFCLCYKHPVL